jgi:glycosyltransferase involved in cell wall biosynthesis
MATIKNLDVKLSILGTGELEEDLKTRVRELNLEDKVEFLGYQENPYIYFKNSDVFVLPSRIEGFSNVALENLGLGVPVLANDFKGGINEMIKSGLNGEIISFDSEKNFEEVLKRVLSYKENSFKISKDAKMRFDKKRILKEYEKKIV